jgi:hypothetical protein
MQENWIGIRASAGLAIFGSATGLAIAGFTLYSTLVMHPPPGSAPPFPMAVVGLVVAALFAFLSAWGIWTAIGIFRRRGWARVSIVVFAVLLTIMGVGAALTILFMPLPVAEGLNQGRMDAVRWGVAGFYGLLVAIGVWWLVLFNLSSTKEYFAQDASYETGARPLSVSVIGWYLLAGSLFMVAGAVIRAPAFFFGAVVRGWGGFAVYMIFAGTQILLGRGLLRLEERARVGAIAYLCLTALNAVLTLTPPGLAAKMQILQREMLWLFPAGTTTQAAQPGWVTVLIGIAYAALPIWFLVRQRTAFVNVATEQPVRALKPD